MAANRRLAPLRDRPSPGAPRPGADNAQAEARTRAGAIPCGEDRERPALIMVLAPVLGLLLWAGLIALLV